MTLAPHIRTLGRGPGRSRALTQDEASDAMQIILSGQAAPEAVGALLMLMRLRGECAEEVAGFTAAMRDHLPVWPGAAPMLDWPSYAAGRTRGLPWFLLAARLVAQSGVPVLLHGWNSHQATVASVQAALPDAGIGCAQSPEDAVQILSTQGIAYLPLGRFAPKALELLRLREVLGLRSVVNTVMRMMNPAGANCSVQGVFHPPYIGLQTDAAGLLGRTSSLVIKGGGGEFERHPGKAVALTGQRDRASWSGTAPALLGEAEVRLADGPQLPQTLRSLTTLWDGSARDPFAEAIVTGTAALALLTLGHAPDVQTADQMAAQLWANRNDPVAPSKDPLK